MNKFANSLFRSGGNIPVERRVLLFKEIQIELTAVLTSFEKEEIPDAINQFLEHDAADETMHESPATRAVLKWCSKLKPKKLSNKEKQNVAGKQVVDKIGIDGLPDFIKRWRQLFLDNM